MLGDLKDLFREGLGTFLTRTLGVAFSFGLTALLAHVLTTEDMGAYFYLIAISTLASILTTFGLPQLTLRETAKNIANKQWGGAIGIWKFSVAIILANNLVLICAAILFKETLLEIFNNQADIIFYGLFFIPLLSLLRWAVCVLSGIKRVQVGQFLESILYPTLIIVLLATVMSAPHGSLDISSALQTNIIALIVTTLLSVFLIYQLSPSQVISSLKSKYELSAWTHAALPLALASGLSIINRNTDMLMLGVFSNTTNIAVYKVASQCGILVSFGLGVVGLVIAPKIAALSAENSSLELQTLVTAAARLGTLACIIPFFFFLIFGAEFLSFFFGTEYTKAYHPLLVLAVGQIVIAIFGSAGVLLTMSGHEKEVAKSMSFTLLIKIILNSILIPYYGAIGAATSTMVSFMSLGMILHTIANKKIGINSSAFYLATKRL